MPQKLDAHASEWWRQCAETLQSAVYSAPRGSDPQGQWRRVEVRAVGEGLQLAFHTQDKVTHRNLNIAEAALELQQLMPQFKQAEFFTPAAHWQLLYSKKGKLTTLRHPPRENKAQAGLHNRTVRRLIPETPVPWLIALDVMTPEGRVKAAMQQKFRQINRFVEFVDDIYDQLSSQGVLHIVDFGCGKSYLTFALHHYLTQLRKRTVEIVGLDLKTDVVARCEKLARETEMNGLRFEVGDIAGYKTEKAQNMDMVVSLHACDTATDAALAQAIRWNTGVIMCVPCCQHELRPQIQSELLQPMLRHGILKERFAALLTDTLRAELLEQYGYRVQVIEFIDMEHTAKNIMLRAIRTRGTKTRDNGYGQLTEAFSVNIALEKMLRNTDIDE